MGKEFKKDTKKDIREYINKAVADISRKCQVKQDVVWNVLIDMINNAE